TLTGLPFGIVPALRACRGADLQGLREGSRSGVGGSREVFRSILIVAEVSISIVLLVACGLLLRALLHVQSTDTGFRTDNVITMRTVLPVPEYQKTSSRTAFYQRVLEGIRALPHAPAAGYTSLLPL